MRSVPDLTTIKGHYLTTIKGHYMYKYNIKDTQNDNIIHLPVT